MKEIELANGRGTALVDDGDYELVSKFSWRLSTYGYALGAKAGEQIDHIKRGSRELRRIRKNKFWQGVKRWRS